MAAVVGGQRDSGTDSSCKFPSFDSCVLPCLLAQKVSYGVPVQTTIGHKCAANSEACSPHCLPRRNCGSFLCTFVMRASGSLSAHISGKALLCHC